MAGRPTVEERSGIVDSDDGVLWAALQALADPVRLRIVRMLSERERRICQLTEALRLSQGTVSHHVGVLKRAGLVLDRRDAPWSCYRLDPEATARLRQSLAEMLDTTRMDSTPADRCDRENGG